MGSAKFYVRCFVCYFSIAVLSLSSAHASIENSDITSYQPQVDIVRIDRVNAPQIDGDISDAAWVGAAVISKFYQVEPVGGAEPTEETLAYLLHDEKNLYIAFHVKYKDPTQLVANIMRRDGPINRDDEIRLLLDTYDTGRDSFFFTFNALGARWDGLVENNRNITGNWDAIWQVKTAMVEDGWTAEVVIPFQSISLDANADAWGLQITRKVTHNNEKIRWASIDQSREDWDMSNAGRLAGVKGVDNGVGLDVQTFGIASWRHDWGQPDSDVFNFELSGNAYYKITPSLTGTLTLNTDFSDSPLDQRQVNTGRFSLFFPETRDFFLQDQSVFAFGGRAFDNVNGRPFFSRRVGIVNGEAVDILAGAKLSGAVGSTTLGALTVRTKSTDDIDAQQLSVARASTKDLADSRVGFIVANGDPTGGTSNTVAGADFQYKTSSLLGRGGQFLGDFYYLQSLSDNASDEGDSYGFRLSYPNDRWSWFTQFKQLDENYSPKLGFVNRPGIRLYDGSVRRRWRPADSFLRTIDAGTDWAFTTDLDGELETRSNVAWTQATTQPGDLFFIRITDSFELIRDPFFLPNNVTVSPGRYHWTRAQVAVETSRNRKIAFAAGISCCDWFDGNRRDTLLRFVFQPNRHFDMRISHDINDISLPGGDVVIHISSANPNVNFSPSLQYSSDIQYDNVSEALTYFGRLRWEIRPQTELFASISHGAITDFERFQSIQTGSVIRLGNTFRF